MCVERGPKSQWGGFFLRPCAPQRPALTSHPFARPLQVGDIIANKLIPNAVLYFTGEIWDYEDESDDEEEEEEMDGEDLDDDDDDVGFCRCW